jgi:hypothetical protein
MKLNEMASTGFFKGLVYGDSGSGKTIFAASFPGPIEYWDFDHKISSAAHYYKKDAAKLEGIDVHQFANLPREKRIPAWEVRNNLIADCVRNNKPLPFKTLVVDSLTTFTAMIMDDYIVRSQRGIKRAHPEIPAMQDYQMLDKHLSLIVPSLLSLDCNVVMLGHLKTDKDESTGAIIRQPLMAGAFAGKLPIYFEEVYVSKVSTEGKYVLQTQSDSMYKCRTQRNLPKEIATAFESVAPR